MVTVEDISSLVQPSATHLMTLILEHLEGLEGRALAQLISSLLNLRHLV